MRQIRVWRAGLAAALLVAAALAASCGSAGGPALEGTRWRLASLGGRPPAAGAQVTLEFRAGGAFGGSAGCNQYGGRYRVPLALTDIAATQMACADQALNEQESAFLQALGRAAAYDLSAGRLTLRDSAGAELMVLSQG